MNSVELEGAQEERKGVVLWNTISRPAIWGASLFAPKKKQRHKKKTIENRRFQLKPLAWLPIDYHFKSKSKNDGTHKGRMLNYTPN